MRLVGEQRPAFGRRRRQLTVCMMAAALCLAWLGLVGDAQAATWQVTTTADTAPGGAGGTCQPSSCSLRQALHGSADGDTIVVPASTTPYQVRNGPLVVLHRVTIVGAGAGSTTIANANTAATRVFNIEDATGTVTLRDLTVTGGASSAADGMPSASGGGIDASGPLILDGVTVTGNSVDDTGNDFDAGGGGIYSTAPLTLIDSTVSNNTVTVTSSAGDGGGGGILMGQTSDNSDNLTLLDSSVTGNTADVVSDGTSGTDANGGGGIYQDGGDLSITGSEISGNTATIATTPTATSTPTDGGGGIFMFGNVLLLQDSTVAGNTADGPGPNKSGGGGVLDSGNQSSYVNDTITGNTTDVPAGGGDEGGGGLMLNDVKYGVVIASSTINANSAPNSGGGGINSVLTSATEVTDSIVAGGVGDSAGNGNCSGAIQSGGYNLTDDSPSDNTCSLTAAGDILGASPLLAGLANNGGPVPTEALQAGSPARAAGNPGGCTGAAGQALTTDARGALRPAGAGCDIGAYQVALPAVATGAAFVTGSGVVLTGTASDPDPRAATVTFQYGATSAYGNATTAQTLAGGAGTTGFSDTLDGLAPGTYHFRIVASGPDGTTAGPDGVFTVAAAPVLSPRRPLVVTQAPLRVDANRATLLGAVDPEGQVTRYRFVWGRSGHRMVARTRTRTIRAGTSLRAVVTVLSRLRPHTRYSVRLIAVNATGRRSGRLVHFTTRRRRSTARRRRR